MQYATIRAYGTDYCQRSVTAFTLHLDSKVSLERNLFLNPKSERRMATYWVTNNVKLPTETHHGDTSSSCIARDHGQLLHFFWTPLFYSRGVENMCKWKSATTRTRPKARVLVATYLVTTPSRYLLKSTTATLQSPLSAETRNYLQTRV